MSAINVDNSADFDGEIKYHIDGWKLKLEDVNAYNRNLMARFSTIFTILTGAWVIFFASYFVPFDPTSTMLSAATAGGIIAPILFCLLYLHEMRMLLQHRMDRYTMFQHIYILKQLTDDSNAKRKTYIKALDATIKTSASAATTIFMILSNALALLIFSSGLIMGILNKSVTTDFNTPPMRLAIIVVSVVCISLYMVGAITTKIEYDKFCSELDEELLSVALVNDWKVPGIEYYKTRRKRRAQPNSRWKRFIDSISFVRLNSIVFILSEDRVSNIIKKKALSPLKNFFKHTESNTLEDKLINSLRTYKTLSHSQRKSVYNAIKRRWFKNKNGGSTSTSENTAKIAFIDVTDRCNLQCKYCFSYASDEKDNKDIDFDWLCQFLDHASVVGVRAIIFSGGEPLCYPRLFEIMALYPQYLFLFFTNAMSIDKSTISSIKAVGNVIPILSIDGKKTLMDQRRGSGVYEKVVTSAELLSSAKIGYGLSITVGKDNVSDLSKNFHEVFQRTPSFYLLLLMNCIDEQTNSDVYLSNNEYLKFSKKIANMEKERLFVNLPHDEHYFEGKDCVAGKHLFNISIDGRLRACPYSRNYLTEVDYPIERLLFKIKNNCDNFTKCQRSDYFKVIQ